MRNLEVCATSYHEANEAYLAGAKRIELCSALEIGGVTPSYGCIKTIREKLPNLAVNVLIRPRGGDFCYTNEEVQVMISDIEMCKSLGVNGVVIGALTKEGSIDLDTMTKLMETAKGINVTFHRAFDCCNNPFEALEQIISLGCNRILTSGQAKRAPEGIEMLKKLVEAANNRIIIMPGCGITPLNICEIEAETKATEFHSSAHFNKKVDICNEKSHELFGEICSATHRDVVTRLLE
ncbi:MAG: copper homeostasis protein CutC [Paludibacteraceae bacterium]|nr:copper homeostasis protein CutC [Paludibacteraceae bacterium]